MTNEQKIAELEESWKALQDKALTICMEIAGHNHMVAQIAGVWNDQERRARYTDEELASIDHAIGSF